jgi:hypothetical protein
MANGAIRFRYRIILPDGTQGNRETEVDRPIVSRDGWEKVKALMVHPFPDGTRIENVRQVDMKGKDLDVQPDYLNPEDAKTIKGAAEPVAELPAP